MPRRRIDKDPFQRAQDFAAARGITCLVIGFVIALFIARLAGFGCSP